MFALARLKQVEDFPDWMKCCEKMIKSCRKYSGSVVIVDLSNIYPVSPDSEDDTCMYCHRPNPKTIAVGSLSEWDEDFYIDSLDIDEGKLFPTIEDVVKYKAFPKPTNQIIYG